MNAYEMRLTEAERRLAAMERELEAIRLELLRLRDVVNAIASGVPAMVTIQ